MFYKSGYEWYMNISLCKNLQNINRNETGKFGATEVKISGSEWEKPNFEKTPFKDILRDTNRKKCN